MTTLFDSYPSTVYGYKVVGSDTVPPRAKIQVRPLTLSDGTRLLSEEFLGRENEWWRERFGTEAVAYLIDDLIVMSRGMEERLRAELYESVDRHLTRDLEKALTGGRPLQTNTADGKYAGSSPDPKFGGGLTSETILESFRKMGLKGRAQKKDSFFDNRPTA